MKHVIINIGGRWFEAVKDAGQIMAFLDAMNGVEWEEGAKRQAAMILDRDGEALAENGATELLAYMKSKVSEEERAMFRLKEQEFREDMIDLRDILGEIVNFMKEMKRENDREKEVEQFEDMDIVKKIRVMDKLTDNLSEN